jgi:hypothetical protein
VIKIKEVFPESTRYKTDQSAHAQTQMRIKKQYVERDGLLNPSYIVAAYPHLFQNSADKAMLAENFDDKEKFTRVILDGNSFRSSEIIIKMAFEDLAERLA